MRTRKHRVLYRKRDGVIIELLKCVTCGYYIEKNSIFWHTEEKLCSEKVQFLYRDKDDQIIELIRCPECGYYVEKNEGEVVWKHDNTVFCCKWCFDGFLKCPRCNPSVPNSMGKRRERLVGDL